MRSIVGRSIVGRRVGTRGTVHSIAGAVLGGIPLAALGAVAFSAAVAHTAAAQTAATTLSDQQLIKDFVHYVRIRQDELAVATARAILDRGLDPQRFVAAVEDSPRQADFDDAVLRAMTIPAAEEAAAELYKLYQQGRLDRARNPDEIVRNIQLLVQGPRARMLARDRLLAAGEYAVQQLFDEFLRKADPAMEAQVGRVLEAMGPDAVAPLCAALAGVRPEVQARIATVLVEIGRPEAGPFLLDAAQRATNERVANTLRNAGVRLGAAGRTAEAYLELAERYYREPLGLTRFPGETHQLLWNYRPAVGLYPTPVRTEVYHEAVVMTLVERAIAMGDDGDEAVALWIAANFSREIDTAELEAQAGSGGDYENPVYAQGRRETADYAAAAGPRIVRRVLERALDDADTPLARRAIWTIGQTAGQEILVGAPGKPGALVRAMRYPDRRVRFEAALAIAQAKPSTSFDGAGLVVATLAGAVLDADARYALVVSSDAEHRGRLTGLLNEDGYDTLAPAATLAAAAEDVADVAGVDIVVASVAREETMRNLLERIRTNNTLRAAPVVVLGTPSVTRRVRAAIEADKLVFVLENTVSDAQIIAAIRQLALRAAGPAVTEAQAEHYAADALRAIRDVAVGRGQGMPLEGVDSVLVRAMRGSDGDVRDQVAGVLAELNSARAQRALADEMLAASGADEAVFFCRLVAASARAFGPMLDDGQVARFVSLHENASGRVATTTAALLGALDLPGSNAAGRILSDSQAQEEPAGPAGRAQGR